jgi:hypothetical protein
MPTTQPAVRLLLVPSLLLAAAHAQAMDGWAFSPPEDTFSADAQLDLRSLNEKVAGESGFVALSKDGNDFVLGNGKPAHFWCLNGGAEKTEDLAHEARFLAKHGVNMLRLHMQLQPGDNSQVTDVNHAVVERIWHTVAAMKKEGIYCTISPYWACTAIKPTWNIKGKEGKGETGVLFINPTLQGGYKAWLKALYTEKNPDTGVPLAQEPAVALIQLQNEDSLLFWTMIGFINEKGEPYDQLRKGFGDFAKKKYGDLDKAFTAWGGDSIDDDKGNGLLGFHQVWEITTNPGGPKGERIADQVEYWSQTMYDFNKAMVKYLREDLGCKQLINAGNWRPADVVHQFDAEHWSYTATDVIAVNRYIGGVHLGPDAGWAINPGDHYTNQSITLDPTALPINCKQVVGHPTLITEGYWVLPDLYQSEAPLAIAAYSSLTGFDGYYWFVSGAREWDIAHWDWGKDYKWNCSTPMGIGQFPAAALMYRHGDIKPGDVVVHEERELSDIWHEKTPLIAEEAGYDPNRDAQLPTKSSVKTTVNPLAFLVGRCEVVYGGDSAKNKVADMKKYIDEDKKTVTSTTGEEKIDYDKGLLTVNAPKAQGAAGFLGKCGDIALGDVTITCKNDYATITVVAMDDKPIKESAKLLVQIGTVTRPTGWADHPDEFDIDDQHHRAKGFTVDSNGANPWAVEKAQGTVAIRNGKLATATVIDPNGMAKGDAQGSSTGGVYTLTLPPDALYVIITAPGKATEKKAGEKKDAKDAKAK